MVELTGSDGSVCAYEVSVGGSNTAECSAATVGLTLADGKRTLAGLQDHLVQAQTEEYCRQRRRCSHCGSQRPLKDVRARLTASTTQRVIYADAMTAGGPVIEQQPDGPAADEIRAILAELERLAA